MILAMVVAAVLITSALCSGTEAALFSVSKIQAKQVHQAASSAQRLSSRSWTTSPGQLPQSSSSTTSRISLVASLSVAWPPKHLAPSGSGCSLPDSPWPSSFAARSFPKHLGSCTVHVSANHGARHPGLGIGPSTGDLLVSAMTSPFTQGRQTFTTNEGEIALLAQMDEPKGSLRPMRAP